MGEICSEKLGTQYIPLDYYLANTHSQITAESSTHKQHNNKCNRLDTTFDDAIVVVMLMCVKNQLKLLTFNGQQLALFYAARANEMHFICISIRCVAFILSAINAPNTKLHQKEKRKPKLCANTLTFSQSDMSHIDIGWI